MNYWVNDSNYLLMVLLDVNVEIDLLKFDQAKIQYQDAHNSFHKIKNINTFGIPKFSYQVVLHSVKMAL